MMYGYRCLECEEEIENFNMMYGITEKCESCGCEELEEIYELECRECNYNFVGAENDECPECGGLETYES